MNQFPGMTSNWLAETYFPEYKFEVDPDVFSSYAIEDEGQFVTLRRDGRCHRVDKVDWTCTCEFASTMHLPCRHATLYRKHVARRFTIPYASIPSRWLRVGTLEENLLYVDVPIRISTGSDKVKRKKQMTERDKFKSAQDVFSRITTEITDLPVAKLLAAPEGMEAWWGNLRSRDIEEPGSGQPNEPDGASDNGPATQVAATVTAVDEFEEKSSRVQDDQQSGSRLDVLPFNPRAKHVGRPRKDRAAEKTQRSQDRKEYNKGSKLRNALRGVDVMTVEEFLKSRQPVLKELSSFLNTLEVRFRGHKNKKMEIAKRVPNVSCVPCKLPHSVVSTPLDMMERAAPFGETMDLCTPTDPSEASWVVAIDRVREFTQRQLMAMQFICSMTTACNQGMQCYSWLMGKVDTRFNEEGAASLADRLINASPSERLPGFGAGFDLEWVHMYCAWPRCWYHDYFIYAFTMTLASTYKNISTVFLPALRTPAPDTSKGERVPPWTLSLLSGSAEDMVFMPMNVNANHWTCIVVDKTRKSIHCYDSMDKRANHNLLEELAEELVKKSLPCPYQIISLHSPIQKDSDNCGLFVCMFFWRRANKEVGNDYTEDGLLRRRWDIMRMVVNFRDSSKSDK